MSLETSPATLSLKVKCDDSKPESTYKRKRPETQQIPRRHEGPNSSIPINGQRALKPLEAISDPQLTDQRDHFRVSAKKMVIRPLDVRPLKFETGREATESLTTL